MPLTDQSPLENALTRIVGEPGTTAVKAAAPAVSNLLNYAAPMARGIANTVQLGAAQPYTPEAAPAVTAPAATAAVTTAEVAPAAAEVAPVGPDYKNYNEYYANNPEALSREYIRTNANPDYAIQDNPSSSYKYRSDYNKYLATLPTEYQALGKSNVTGEAVRKGLITGVYDPMTKQTYSVGPNVAPGTVLPGSAPAAAPAAPRKPPVNPGPRAPWQKSQQYWKDLAAYKATGAK